MNYELLPVPVPVPGDPFGNVIGPKAVEAWLGNTIRAWIDSHLAVQERLWQLPEGTIDRPALWPTLSQFDLEDKDQLPAIVTVFVDEPDANRTRQAGGWVRTGFRYDISVAVGGQDEDDARDGASRYSDAIASILEQNGSLGGHAETTVVGGVKPRTGIVSVGDSGQTEERAIYTRTVTVWVRHTINRRAGTDSPPADPNQPGGPPPVPETVEVIDIDTGDPL